MKTVILSSIILVLMCVNIYSQREHLETLAAEEKVVMNFSKPAIMDSTTLDSVITARMNAYNIPGLTALINTKEDGIIWKRNYGYANVALQQPVEDSTIFYMASISKTIVTTAIMQFWEADSFDLDDDINEYLDEFQVHIPYHENDTINFRMLMTHTSSIADNYNIWDTLVVCGDSPITLDSILVEYFTPGGIFYNSSLNFIDATPGTVWQYSNFGACILAHLVERFSGMSFDQYCREKIFDPLEMNNTSWFLAGLDTTNIATPYLWQNNQYIPYCHFGDPLYPITQLRTNKFELEHFLTTYMNWGKYNGTTILDSSTIDLILTDHLGYPVRSRGDYQGLIWFQTNFEGKWLWGHTGGNWGCRTGMFYQKNENWGVICFMNSYVNSTSLINILNLLCNYAREITDIEEINTLVKDFHLEQNFPNPFNPITTIKYRISEISFITLKVYDVLGNEIAKLVNEEKTVGNHQVEFDASSLSSGIYFYRIQAGSFVETKKMVLIK